MSRRLMRNIATLTLFCFMATPFYGLVKAANPKDGVSLPEGYEVISTQQIAILPEMKVEIVKRDSSPSKMMRAAIKRSVTFTVNIDGKTDAVTDYILGLTERDTGVKYVLDGSLNNQLSLADGNYAIEFIKVPDGALLKQKNGELFYAIDSTVSSINIVLCSDKGEELFDIYTSAKAKDVSGKYTIDVGNCIYQLYEWPTVEDMIANPELTQDKYVCTFTTDEDAVSHIRVPYGVYTISISGNAGLYVHSSYNGPDNKGCAFINGEEKSYTSIHYLDVDDSNAATVTYTVTDGGTPVENVLVNMQYVAGGGIRAAEQTGMTDTEGKVAFVTVPGTYDVVLKGIKGEVLATRNDIVTVGQNDLLVSVTPSTSTLSDDITINVTSPDGTVNMKGYIEKQSTGEVIRGFNIVDGVAIIGLPESGDYVVRLLSDDNWVPVQRVQTFRYTAGHPSSITIDVVKASSYNTRNLVINTEREDGQDLQTQCKFELRTVDGDVVREINLGEYNSASPRIGKEEYNLVMTHCYRNLILNEEVKNIPAGNEDISVSYVLAEKDLNLTYAYAQDYSNEPSISDTEAVFRFTDVTDPSTQYTITTQVAGPLVDDLPIGDYKVSVDSITGYPDAFFVDPTFVYHHIANENDPEGTGTTQVGALHYFYFSHTKGFPIKFIVEDEDGNKLNTGNINVLTKRTQMEKITLPVQNGTSSIPFKLPVKSVDVSLTDLPNIYEEYGIHPTKLSVTGTETSAIEFRMTPKFKTFSFNLIVTDESNNPMQGLEFTVYKEDGTTVVETIETGADGVSSADLRVGGYVVKNTGVPNDYIAVADEEVTITDTAVSKNKQIKKKSTLINLTFQDKDGNPVVGANVKLYDGALDSIAATDKSKYTGTTNDEGKVSFDVLEGNYGVNVSPSPTGLNIDPTKVLEKVNITAGETKDVPSITLQSDSNPPTPPEKDKGYLFINLVYNGNPINGVVLELSGNDITPVTYTSDGQTIEYNGDVGQYKITVKSLPAPHNLTSPYEQTVVINKDTPQSVTIDIADIEDEVPPDPQDKIGFVMVKVLDQDTGDVIANVPYTLSGDEGTTSHTSSTTEKVTKKIGDYTLTLGILPTDYSVVGQSTMPIVVTESDTFSVTFYLVKNNTGGGDDDDKNKKGIIGVSAEDEDGSKVAGVKYTVSGAKGETKYETSNSVSSLEVDTGNYIVSVSNLPEGYDLTGKASYSVTVVKDGTSSVVFKVKKEEVIPPKPDDDKDKPTVKKGSLTVVSTHGVSPVPNNEYGLYDSTGKLVFRGVTGADGRFTFNDIPVGEYTLSNLSNANPNLGIAGNLKVTIREGENSSIRSDVPSANNNNNNNQPNQNNEFGMLDVSLLNKKGAPVVGAEFTLYDFEDTPTTFTTDDKGNASLRNIRPGEYSVVQTGAGSEKVLNLKRTNVQIRKQETTKLNLSTPNEKGKNVSGYVFDDINANGVYDRSEDEPYKGATVNLLDNNGDLLLSSRTNSDGEYKFSYIPSGDYTVKLTKQKGYNYVDKKYGTNKDSSVINRSGEYEISVDDEDIEDAMMLIVSDELTLNPVIRSNMNENSDDKNKFPTLGDNGNDGLLNDGSGDGLISSISRPNSNIYDIDISGNDALGIGSTGEDKTSNLPKTGEQVYMYVAVLYLLFMFVTLYCFRKFIFDKLVN